MPKLDAAAIIVALPSLSKTDRIAIKAACEVLLETSDHDPAATALYAEVIKLTGATMPFSRLPAGLQAKLKARAPGIAELASGLWPGKTKVQHLVVVRHLLTLLAADLRSRKVPVTVGSITNNLGRLQGVFDSAYPGYREAGLAPMIMAQLVSKKSK